MAIKLFGTTLIGGEAQRKEASANEFITKYPLSSDCTQMQNTINIAKAELASINASRPSTAGGKRIKARNSSALASWISEMNNFNKDLTCGIVSTPNSVSIVPTPLTPANVVAAPTIQTPAPVIAPSVITTKECVVYKKDVSTGAYVGEKIMIPLEDDCSKYQPIETTFEEKTTPTPVLPNNNTTSTTNTTTTQAPNNSPSVIVPFPAMPQVAMEYGNGESTPVIAPTQDKKQDYLMYGALGLLALLVLTRRD